MHVLPQGNDFKDFRENLRHAVPHLHQTEVCDGTAAPFGHFRIEVLKYDPKGVENTIGFLIIWQSRQNHRSLIFQNAFPVKRGAVLTVSLNHV